MPRLSKIGAAALAAFGWTSGTSAVSADFLVVAGGGGSGNGGGGAGGYRTSAGTSGGGGSAEAKLTLNTTQSYTVTVGAGGVAGASGGGTAPGLGGNSTFSTITSTGGGYGGNSGSPSSGGSGGGSQNQGTGGAGTANQGYAGGSGGAPYPQDAASGGGGAGSVGQNANPVSANGTGGNGGTGVSSSITGTSTFYASGGGGAGRNTQGTASAGGGGNAGASVGVAGTASTGGGGGGGAGQGQTGGSGIVIISYAGAQQFSGGIVTSVGGNTIHTFTTSGTLGPITTLSASYLIVAGGGSGGGTSVSTQFSGGGGGAGGLLSGSGITIDPNSNYLVTVGAGGAGGVSVSNSGTSSAFSMVTTTAVGGGYGGYEGGNGASGGSGGGGGGNVPTKTGGAGTSGQGNAGGTGGVTTNFVYGGGGGGGAGAVGGNATASGAGNGGIGSTSSISGTSTYYAGGGGGGAYAVAAGTGGTGGGGAGGLNANGTSGTTNTGGGGGGCGESSTYTGGNGGSGVVIISYAGSTQQMAGGTVTIVGGNVIHTFTSSGYLTPIKYVNNSLRFRSSNSAVLQRTPTNAGNRQKFTISMWVKRGDLTARQGIFAAGTTNSGGQPGGSIYFDNNGAGGSHLSLIGAGGTSYVFQTTQVFRDPSAWYHLVFAWDTTQATDTNRMKMYVNGVQVTSWISSTYPSQNFSTDYNNTIVHDIGARTDDGGTASTYFDGEMTEIYMIDGQQLTPSSFGTFNSYGVWQPITYGGSYGTNGFYLPFNRQAVSYAGSFNGSNQRLTTPAMTSLTGNFTVEFYCNNTGFGSSDSTVIGNYPATTTTSEVLVIQRQTSGNWGVYCGSLAGSGNLTWTPTITSQGSWVHVALVRSGTTVTAYYNGVAVSTATVSTTITLPSGTSIGAYTNASIFFLGYISNLRITNTAVYTSNFVPPTSALTAITGTILLTLQNSSIVDNSTNAYTITNVNGVSTGQTYPFAYGMFQDQGPAGNNWTPTNISGAFGSTLDYLGDAPTLTSATVANYATLNPLDTNSSPTITNGNLSLTSTGASWKSTRSTIGMTTGKFYFEASVTTNSTDLQIGIGSASLAIASEFTASNPSVVYSGGDGSKWLNGSNSSYGSAYTLGQVIGVAFDADARTVTFYLNNTSQGTITTGWSTGLTWLVEFTLYGRGGGSTSGWINFGQQPFVYTPPTGFVALNAYNL